MSFQPAEVKRKKLVGIAKPKPISGSYEPFGHQQAMPLTSSFRFSERNGLQLH
jgi:hypothetical protein